MSNQSHDDWSRRVWGLETHGEERREGERDTGATHNLYLLNLGMTEIFSDLNIWKGLYLHTYLSIFKDGQAEIHAAGSRSGLGQSRIIFPLFLESGSAGEARSR